MQVVTRIASIHALRCVQFFSTPSTVIPGQVPGTHTRSLDSTATDRGYGGRHFGGHDDWGVENLERDIR